MSNTSLLLFFSLLPIVLILVTIYNIDRTKEPLVLLLIFFVLGILSCYGVLKISEFLGTFLPFMSKPSEELNLLENFLYVFVGVALIEEFCKWIIVFLVGYKNKEFDELYDIIVYSVFMSLGFAFFENILYIFHIGELRVAIFRALLAIPAHTCYAIFMGYYLSLSKQSITKKDKVKYISLSILIPVLLHGVYDYCLMSNISVLIGVFLLFIIMLDMVSIKKVKEMVKENKKVQ